MSDPRRSEHTRSAQQGTEQTERIRQAYPPYSDPAYSGQSVYPPSYYPGSAPNSNATNPTDKFPRYWVHGQTPPDQPSGEPPSRRPKAPRWLWIAAALAVLLVAALVVALVIANGAARKQTEVPSLPSSPTAASTTSTPPSSSPSTSAPSSTASTSPTNAGAMQAVGYSVTGEGHAISITYVDNDGMMHTEFNVVLPWSKEVSLPASSSAKANITIINIGHDVTCSLTVDGVEVSERTGVGLTVCNGSS
ncbi:MmpS family transport accessory protein [Candidatus Mycobacterium methanotrophicum]|uniref:MmpS family protein n=1 Tax=Candidatus Mycobacterium methanotrophicum TaxID=2943498 RepID=A0ABY4QNS2_9MYCO|nr:MmpS family transport accessory protein [Candidatus Mycobacterium methanotrophicum]UQX12657.1 MmpS family protein [Candidatus Mycobacterium methanotrophicum]